MVLKRSKNENRTLFIDASKECVKVTKSNKLTNRNIERIINTLTERKDKVKYFSCLINNEEIEKQDYNLSASTYVEKEGTREAIDILKEETKFF